MNLVWGNRYAMTMYEKRPTRWRDLPRRRDDVFLPLLTPWEQGARKVAAVATAWSELPRRGTRRPRTGSSRCLFDVFRHKRHHAAELPPIKPTVAEMHERSGEPHVLPARRTTRTTRRGATRRSSTAGGGPELEPLHRLAMVLHNQYPWDRAGTRLEQVGRIGDDDFVVAFVPRSGEVLGSSGA